MTVRVGVIGVGNIGTAHAHNLAHRVVGSSVSVVFDANSDRARTIAADLGAVAVRSAEELIVHPDVDAVVIASPDDLHSVQALSCLAAGKPTLCEKPLAPLTEDALAVMVAESALGNRLITLGFMRRFDPGYVQLKSRLDAGEVGVPLVVHCVHRNQQVPRDHTSAMSLTNSAVHEIDINRWLLAEEYVSAQVIAGRPSPHAGAAVRDPLLVVLRTTSGVIVEIESFSNARYGYEVRCEVVASEGTLELGDGSFISAAHDGRIGRQVPAQWLGRFSEAYRLELQAWIDSVRGGLPTGPSAWDGYVATAVAGACVAALDTDRPVPVTLSAKPGLY